MHVIALASQKGGVGKTTLSGHLAVQAASTTPGSVVILDTDPQASLTDWWRARAEERPALGSCMLSQLPDQIAIWRQQGVELVVIDTPPAITASIRLVVELSDLVVIPTRPSPHDLRAIGRTVALVEECDKPLLFVINGAAHRARITAAAATELSQYGMVAPDILHQRTDFAASMISGQTVMELDPSGRSAAEIRALWDRISRILGGKTKARRASVRSAA